MKILHYYASNEVTLVTQYVKTLCEAMDAEVSNEVTSNGADAKERLTSSHYDILHIHGCWQYAAYRLACVAWRENTRVVITPHGELEPWVVKEGYWKEKLPKRLLFMKRLIEKAYAVIIQGKMEEECIIAERLSSATASSPTLSPPKRWHSRWHRCIGKC